MHGRRYCKDRPLWTEQWKEKRAFFSLYMGWQLRALLVVGCFFSWWEQFRPSDEVGGRPDWALRTWSNAWAGSEMLAKRLSALLELMRKTHKIFRSIA